MTRLCPHGTLQVSDRSKQLEACPERSNRLRWKARALMPSWVIAARSKLLPVSSTLQYSHARALFQRMAMLKWLLRLLALVQQYKSKFNTNRSSLVVGDYYRSH